MLSSVTSCHWLVEGAVPMNHCWEAHDSMANKGLFRCLPRSPAVSTSFISLSINANSVYRQLLHLIFNNIWNDNCLNIDIVYCSIRKGREL